uniref:Polymerase/primase n=1 Tax=Dulem virus 41 TaxID=3145759 RepID=A0AAU8AYD4_9CAUD
MRYVVSNNTDLFGTSDKYGRMSVEKSLDILRSMKRIGFDTETTSLDCHSGNIRCIQFGNFDVQILIDTYTIDIQLYKELLESEDIQFIVVNGKFDAKYLHNHRICIMNMYDLFLNEQLIYLGYPSYPSASLQGLAHRYAGVSMDKSVRTEIASRGLTPEVIVYACDDVKYLSMIADKQEEELRRQDLCTAAAIEGMTIAPLSYMEWCGVIVSREKWMEKAEDDMRDLKESVEALNKAVIEYSLEHPSPGKILYFDPYSMSKEEQKEWVTNNVQDSNKTKKVKGKTVPVKRKRLKRRPDLDKVVKDGNLEYRKIAYERMSQYPYIYEDPQYDMFHESERYVCDINWSSSGQVIPLLEELGCDVMVEDKDSPTGFKKTCDAKKIKPQRYVHKIVDLYCKYKKLEKVVSTYGPKFLENIHPRTGRVYTNYHQLGTDTTRFSSTDPNLLNLPKNERTRSCFIPREGWLWISQDVKGEESVLMADASRDEAMISEFLEGSGDRLHVSLYSNI